MGTREPSVPLERTEFVRADQTYSILSRIVRATQVDTIVHTFLVIDSTRISGRALHEINVIGTMNLLAAAGQSGSPVRQVVVKSSTLVYGSASTDPTWFREEMPRTSPARTRVERSLLEVEGLVRDFAEDNPATVVSVLRFANVLGTDIVTPDQHQPVPAAVPVVAGFDPLVQFVEEDDVVRCLEYVTRHRIPGLFNVAGAGKLPWSEVADICGTRLLPLPPGGHARAPRPPSSGSGSSSSRPSCESLLRYGRGVDTTRIGEDRVRVPLHHRRGGRELHPGPAPAPQRRRRRRPRTPTSRTSSSSSATPRPWCVSGGVRHRPRRVATGQAD